MLGSCRRKGAKGRREVQTDGLLHLDLVDTNQVELHRIFGRHDIGLRCVQPTDGGVEGVGLTAAGRPGHQDHAPGFQDAVLEAFERNHLEPELGHVQHQVLFVEKPQNDLLTEQGGQRGDPKIELAHLASAVHADLDAAVLGKAFLGDVELGHDLETGGDRFPEPHGRIHDHVENTVDAEPDSKLPLVGLDVDVAGPALERVGEDQVTELDDRSFLAGALELVEVDVLRLFQDLDIVGDSVSTSLSSSSLIWRECIEP